MSQNRRELQVMEISSRGNEMQKSNGRVVYSRSGAHSQRSEMAAARSRRQRHTTGKKDRRHKILGVFLRLLLLIAALFVLAYVALIGILLYRQKHPNRVDFDALQRSRVTFWTGVLGESISLEKELQELLTRNEEAKDFVENYPNREEYLGKDIDLSEDVQEGRVPLLMQWDKRWGYESFGDSNIGLAGCGPTCLSMAYLYFTGDLAGNPREIARYCEENGFYTPSGTSWELWTVGAKEFGLEGAELPLDEKRMKGALDAGKLIVCSMRPGDFTTVGHYILLVGYGEDGFIVNDPNRKENSEKCWNYETLKGQIRNLWEINKAP